MGTPSRKFLSYAAILCVMAMMSPAPAEAVLLGFLDTVSETALTGWACTTANPTVPLQVAVLQFGPAGTSYSQIIAQVTADQPREPAVGAACGSGNTNHGFIVNLPPHVP